MGCSHLIPGDRETSLRVLLEGEGVYKFYKLYFTVCKRALRGYNIHICIYNRTRMGSNIYHDSIMPLWARGRTPGATVVVISRRWFREAISDGAAEHGPLLVRYNNPRGPVGGFPHKALLT